MIEKMIKTPGFGHSAPVLEYENRYALKSSILINDSVLSNVILFGKLIKPVIPVDKFLSL